MSGPGIHHTRTKARTTAISLPPRVFRERLAAGAIGFLTGAWLFLIEPLGPQIAFIGSLATGGACVVAWTVWMRRRTPAGSHE